jgi:hypothetical protein
MSSYFTPVITLPTLSQYPQTLSYDFIRSIARFLVISKLEKYPVPTTNGTKVTSSYFVIVDKETANVLYTLTRTSETGEQEYIFIPVHNYSNDFVENEIGRIYECRFILSEVDQTYSNYKYKYLVVAPDYQTLLKAQKDPNTEGCVHLLTELPIQHD